MARGSGSEGRLAELLRPLRRDPGLRRLTGAFLANELGDGITNVVVPLAVYEITGSAVLLGTVAAVESAMALAGSLVGGVLADRLDRWRLLRVTIAARIGLLGLAVLLGNGVGALVVALLVLAGSTLENPAAEAAIRDRAGPDDLAQVAAIRKASRTMATLFGPAVGGLLLSFGDVRLGLAASLAAATVALLALPRRPDPADAPVTRHRARQGDLAALIGRAVRGGVQDAREGLSHMLGHLDLRVAVAAAALDGFLIPLLLITSIVHLADLPGAPDGAYGFAISAYAAGAIFGLLAAGTVRWRATVPVIQARSTAVYGLLCLAGVVRDDWRLLAGAWLLWGIAYGPAHIVTDVALVRETPTALLGRAYAGIGLASQATAIIAGLVAGVLSEFLPARAIIAGIAAVYLVPGTTAFWVVSRRSVPHRLDA